MTQREKGMNTKRQILKVAHQLFLEAGYCATNVAKISKTLGISTGNLTFHFPTKEHILAEFVKKLYEFQWEVMFKEVGEDGNYIYAYCLEQVIMAWICNSNPVARELYIAAYEQPMTLAIVRYKDKRKTKEIFAEMCKEWNDIDFIYAESIVSGIEYGMLRSEGTEGTDFVERTSRSLDLILSIYNVPKELRSKVLNVIFKMDYKEIGSRIFDDFFKYIETVNDSVITT